MRKSLVVGLILLLTACTNYPYRNNYYGSSSYVTSPYYGGYGYGAVFQDNYIGYRNYEGFRGGYPRGYGEVFQGEHHEHLGHHGHGGGHVRGREHERGSHGGESRGEWR